MVWSATPYETGGTSGNEINPDGRVITVVESALTHPTHADGLVLAGDPVLVGEFQGIARTSASATTDLIAVVLEGLFDLTCTAQNAGGDSTIAFGDALFISVTTAVVSKVATGRPFATALGGLAGSSTPGVIPIAVGRTN